MYSFEADSLHDEELFWELHGRLVDLSGEQASIREGKAAPGACGGLDLAYKDVWRKGCECS